MKKQILFFFVCLYFFISPGNAQNLNRNYIDGIMIGTRKSVVIDTVLSKLYTYFENDIDGVVSFNRKKYKVNLSKKSKRDVFITTMVDDLRTQLQTTDNWQTVDSYQKYGVYISKLLGQNITFPGFGKAREERNGDGDCELYFKNDTLSVIYGNLQVTKDYTIYSGYSYDNKHLSNSADILRKNYGSFTFKQGATTWNSCSTRPEHVPVITYSFNSDEDYSATFTFTYGILQRRVTGGTKDQCVAAGNHLTTISFYIAEK